MYDAAGQPIKVDRREPTIRDKVYRFENIICAKVLHEEFTTSKLTSHGYGIATVTIELQEHGGKSAKEVKENLDGIYYVTFSLEAKVGM